MPSKPSRSQRDPGAEGAGATGPRRLERWRLDADADGEPVLAGRLDGRPHRTAPLAQTRLPYDVTVADGTVYELGKPDPRAVDPWLYPVEVGRAFRAKATAIAGAHEAGERPSKGEIAAAPLVDGWWVESLGYVRWLVGRVSGHPRLFDGDWVTTSPMVYVSPDRRWVRTVSRLYRLGSTLHEALRAGEPGPHDPDTITEC